MAANPNSWVIVDRTSDDGSSFVTNLRRPRPYPTRCFPAHTYLVTVMRCAKLSLRGVALPRFFSRAPTIERCAVLLPKMRFDISTPLSEGW
jgi:hypothetical protein